MEEEYEEEAPTASQPTRTSTTAAVKQIYCQSIFYQEFKNIFLINSNIVVIAQIVLTLYT